MIDIKIKNREGQKVLADTLRKLMDDGAFPLYGEWIDDRHWECRCEPPVTFTADVPSCRRCRAEAR